MDVGWNRTAVLWGAWDRQADIVYLTDEHYQGEQPPQVHADAIQRRGDWIPGVIDPAARGRSQVDGRALIDEYRSMGLDLTPANNEVEAGIFAVYRRLVSGRLRVFSTLTNFRAEIRLYRRDDKGKVVKERDHLMDTARYLVMSGMARAVVRPVYGDEDFHRPDHGRNARTGY